MAIEDVTERLHRICGALGRMGVPYALVGGQAVALWVATKDPAAVRTTKGVDILLRRDDLPRAQAAARSVDLEYCEVLGVGMFLDARNPHPRQGVHLIWAGEKVRPEHPAAAPSIDEQQGSPGGPTVVSLEGLVRMKLAAWRDQDRVHLRDMIDVGLIGREMLDRLVPVLASRLESLLAETGR